MAGMCSQEVDEVNEQSRELHLLRTMIVSGELKGTLPPGFLEQLRDLPNEIILHIWKFLPRYQLVSLRQVSKRWKSLWESLKQPKRLINTLMISERDGKFVLTTDGYSCATRRLYFAKDEASVRQAISLVAFWQGFSGSHLTTDRSNLLGIVDSAACPMVLEAIADRGWPAPNLYFQGDITAIKEDHLISLLSSFASGGHSKISLKFVDVTVDNGVITDKVIETIGPRLNELVILPKEECLNKGAVKLTDRSLPHLVKLGMISVIPDASSISSNALKVAVKNLLQSDGDHSLMRSACLSFPKVSNNHMKRLAQITFRPPIPNIHRKQHEWSFMRTPGRSVKTTEFSKLDNGMVEFKTGNLATGAGVRLFVIDVFRVKDMGLYIDRYLVNYPGWYEPDEMYDESADDYSDYLSDDSGDSWQSDMWHDVDAMDDAMDVMDELDFADYDYNALHEYF